MHPEGTGAEKYLEPGKPQILAFSRAQQEEPQPGKGRQQIAK
jgi:hypothetical protein